MTLIIFSSYHLTGVIIKSKTSKINLATIKLRGEKLARMNICETQWICAQKFARTTNIDAKKN